MYIQVRTSDRKRILESKDIQIFDDGSRRLLIGLSDTVECLGDHPEELESLATACLAKHGDLGRVALHAVLGTLADNGLLVLAARAEAPGATVIPYTRVALDKILSPIAPGHYKLSRFTLLRPGDQGNPCRLECSRAHAHIEVMERELAALAGACIATREVEVLAEGTQSDKEVDLVSRALVAGGFVTSDPAAGDGEIGETELPYWNFHELYFHSRSRAGRHHDPMGATFKMANRFPPEPAVKRTMNAIARISLPIPNYSDVARRDVPLTMVLEARRSIRSHGGPALSINQLGDRKSVV